MNRPFCFVLMPFGKKSDVAGKLINFDAVYQDFIAPAIIESGLEPIRIPYKLNAKGEIADPKLAQDPLVKSLHDARQGITDSSIFQLLEDFPDVNHTKTDVFRQQVNYSLQIKEKLAQARSQGLEALLEIKQELGSINQVEAGIAIDLFLSFRAVKAWQHMIDLVAEMSPPLAATVMVQEQLGLALNRNGDREKAEKVLKNLIQQRGASSETYGILGRVYKDCWETAKQEGNPFLAKGLLGKAIDAYIKGFEADWRDAYPGINAVTLMEIKNPPDPRRERLIPVVSYAVEQRIANAEPDYWDYATLLELAVLAKDKKKALETLANSLAAVREVWEPETTARNLRLIDEAREERQEIIPWVKEIIKSLEDASNI